MILIPINIRNAHWAVAAINFRLNRIEVYDSIPSDHTDMFRVRGALYAQFGIMLIHWMLAPTRVYFP